jgi:hypothetical protein
VIAAVLNNNRLCYKKAFAIDLCYKLVVIVTLSSLRAAEPAVMVAIHAKDKLYLEFFLHVVLSNK